MSKLLAYKYKDKIEAGCDEAGRGCLSGPVVAAAVILPKDFRHELLNDSKKLSEAQRRKLVPIIKKHALSYSISFVSQQEIDKINILNASILGMQKAVDNLKVTPEMLLIDGNRFKKHRNYEHECIIKGDGKYLSIAAASVLAKTARDEYMEELHEKFPEYNWKKNKGYPTKEHRLAILQHGDNEHHRKSFTLISDKQLNLFK